MRIGQIRATLDDRIDWEDVVFPRISKHPTRAIVAIVFVHGVLDTATAYYMMDQHGVAVEANPIASYFYAQSPALFLLSFGAMYGISTVCLLHLRDELESKYAPVLVEMMILIGLSAVVSNVLVGAGIVPPVTDPLWFV